MIIKKNTTQTILEEIFNSITHGIGALLGVFGLIILIEHHSIAGNTKLLISVIIYGITLILLYGVSMLYHALHNARAKAIFKVLDHSAIYLLIAGTYTPFTIVSIGGVWGWTLFAIIWSLAAVGLVYKAFFMDRWPAFSVGLYICMGWLAIIAIKPILYDLPPDAFAWILAGGLFYTLGIIFFAFDHKIYFFHSLWHLCVLAGSACHFYAVLYYVTV